MSIERSTTMEMVKKTYQKWLYIPDKEWYTIEVPLAVAKEREAPGDPEWLYVIAPPGGRKTEQIRALKNYSRIYTIDSLTPATLISGMVEKDPDTGENVPIAGILRDIDGKVLVIKDFTTILSYPEMTRNEIYGQLRAIYDGYFEKAFGTLPGPIRVKASIGLIACVTPAIDKYTKAHSALGERFLKIRIHTDRHEASKKAYDNVELNAIMRKELEDVTVSFLNNIMIDPNKLPKLDKAQEEVILALGEYITLMRCRVFCRYFRGQIVDLDYEEPEMPTRICKQLKKLAMLLAIIRDHDCVMIEDIETVIQVAHDTALPTQEKIASAMVEVGSPMTYLDIAGHSKLHNNTVKNELEKMESLHIVENVLVEGIAFYRFTEDFASRAIMPMESYGKTIYSYVGGFVRKDPK